MEVTRNVILDLLPLYSANEASADTRALVKKYLETDPELADIASELVTAELPGDIPIPLTKEDKMEAYKEAKRLMFLRTIILAAIISSSIIVLMVFGVVAWGFLVQ